MGDDSPLHQRLRQPKADAWTVVIAAEKRGVIVFQRVRGMQTYVERSVPSLGPRIPAETLSTLLGRCSPTIRVKCQI